MLVTLSLLLIKDSDKYENLKIMFISILNSLLLASLFFLNLFLFILCPLHLSFPHTLYFFFSLLSSLLSPPTGVFSSAHFLSLFINSQYHGSMFPAPSQSVPTPIRLRPPGSAGCLSAFPWLMLLQRPRPSHFAQANAQGTCSAN